MNYITLRNRSEATLISYYHYLPECVKPFNEQLLDEIIRLREVVKRVDYMTEDDAAGEVEFMELTIGSKLNRI